MERQHVQRLGRIVRAAPGKRAARLYYLYVRDSAEDAAYLPGQPGEAASFPLRYTLLDGSFSDGLYEYAAGELLRASQARGDPEARWAELRRCLAEAARKCPDRHGKNYWMTMHRLHREFSSGDDAVDA